MLMEYLFITLDLMKMPFAEKVEIEGNDGVTREGVFIPFSENNIKYSKLKAYVNFCTYKIKEKTKMERPFLKATHILKPYWTPQHADKMKSLGYDMTPVVGNMRTKRMQIYIDEA